MDGRLLFGVIARKYGFLTDRELSELMQEQAVGARDGARARLGVLCRRKRLMTGQQVHAVLDLQKRGELREEDKLFGALAIENGFASEPEVELALHLQKAGTARGPRPRIGEILIEGRSLTGREVQALLRAQERLKVKSETPPPAPGVDFAQRRDELLRLIGERALRAGISGAECEAARSASTALEAAFERFRALTSRPAQLVQAKADIESEGMKFRQALIRLGRYVVDHGIAIDGNEAHIAEVRALESPGA